MRKYAWKNGSNNFGQAILNKYCLTSQRCCWLPSKAAVIVIALMGILQSILHISFFFTGLDLLVHAGVHEIFSQIIIHTYAVIAILLFSLHILLLIAALIYSEPLILLYQWSMIFYSAIDFVFFLFMSFVSDLISALILCSIYIIYWTLFYIFIFSVINGFRRNIHTIVIVIT
ncbi:uncharacterized protein LOC125076224 [Vanessa atalanta]|uniref:uncharacterized protein LOC125076224 n=1 Tax=Vanessa atalanta TaxID=42275 RepID=UPI001FCD7B84|nr:uncharacterized protein LOC125076224 [Vanessa atalanta]